MIRKPVCKRVAFKRCTHVVCVDYTVKLRIFHSIVLKRKTYNLISGNIKFTLLKTQKSKATLLGRGFTGQSNNENCCTNTITIPGIPHLTGHGYFIIKI